MIGTIHPAVAANLWPDVSSGPPAAFFVFLGGYLYARGLKQRPTNHVFHHPYRRIASYYAGLLAIFIALASPLDALADDLFTYHMTQHVLLFMIAPPLVLYGAPMIPVLRGIPRNIRRAVVIPFMQSPITRSAFRFMTRPLIAWSTLVIALVFWHLPLFYDLALSNEWIHDLEHVCFTITGGLFWWNVIEPIPIKPRISTFARVPYAFLMSVPTGVLGAFLTLSPHPWYSPYVTLAPLNGMTVMEDQQIGGVIMWVPCSFILLAAFVIALYSLVTHEQQEQLARET